MTVKVQFFASFKERTGVKEIIVDLADGATVLELKKIIIDLYPGLKPFLSMMVVSVNHNFAFDRDLIPVSAEIALFPPVSGGEEESPTIIKDYRSRN